MGRILNWVMVWVVVLGGIFGVGVARGAEVIPPVPGEYFNDYAHVTSDTTVEGVNVDLEAFEKQTSNQIVVAIYPKMESDSDIADYTVRVAQAWKVGGKLHNNGVVLFVFIQDRKLFIQVGYGLEGVLPDATCKEIIDQLITPEFKKGDYDMGLNVGVTALMAATQGEYKGTGFVKHAKGANEDEVRAILPWVGLGVGIFLLIGLLLLILHFMGGTFYRNHQRSIGFCENTYLFIFSMILNIVFSSGSSSSSSSSSSGGGEGFSSGGGSFGGGGAGGSW